MKPNSTLINVILDRSGSMTRVWDATIEGLNAFIADQQKLPGEAKMTLVQFDDQYQVDYFDRDLKDVQPLNRDTYLPRGGTALFDAIGRTIDIVGQKLSALVESERPEKVIVVIQTDGEENASREFTKAQVFEKIAHQRDKYNWQFVFLGANQDAIATATSFGIGANAALSYNADALGTSKLFSAVSRGVGMTRSGMLNQVSYSAQVQAAVLDSSVSLDDLQKALDQQEEDATKQP